LYKARSYCPVLFFAKVAPSKLFFPCRLKYSISIVADKGLKKSLYTSARLKKGEVIYLETHVNRYKRLTCCLDNMFYVCWHPEIALILAYYSLSFNSALVGL
jgi:hypothetical protein